MNRKDFLKGAGVAGLGFVFGKNRLSAKNATINEECVLIPSETPGPFPLDLSENAFYLRQDVREDRTGTPLNLRMKIIGLENCAPMENVRVNIWHCDKDGNYSGYQSEAGLTYLRGYQMTDVNGEVEFVTVFPGWYNGRVCHIHFQVYVNETYAAISQLTFDHDTVNAVYNANPDEYTKGEDPLSPGTDGIFSDGYDLQLASLEPNSTSGEYDAYLEVTVQGEGVLGLNHRQRERAKYLDLGQNYPNPFKGQTTIPFSIKYPSQVSLDLWDVKGQKVKTLFQNDRAKGDYQVEVDLEALGLPLSNYLYQLEVTNDQGTFRLPKLMTALR